MVPSSYNAFFTAIATGAAALIGLLFVAVSVRDETIFGPKAVAGGSALAITAFTGLVNSLLVSLLALIPQDNVGYGAAIIAVVDIVGHHPAALPAALGQEHYPARPRGDRVHHSGVSTASTC